MKTALVCLLALSILVAGCMSREAVRSAAEAPPVSGTEPPPDNVTLAPSGAGDAPSPTAGPAPADAPILPRSVVAIGEMPNVYHEAFRRPHLTVHPSTYIPGYPTTAIALNLSLDAADFDEAVARDAAVWAAVLPQTLYWIPGTNFVGLRFYAIDIGFPYVDAWRHATGVASNLAGSPYGAAPEAGIVVADYVHMARVALANPWIDATSRSVSGWGIPVFLGELDFQRISVAGRISLSAVANNPEYFPGSTQCGVVYAIECESNGPPWIVSVGQVKPDSVGGEWIYGIGPLDVSARPQPCALGDDLAKYDDRCGGTSYATPYTAGLLASLIARVRGEWGWQVCPDRALACTSGPAPAQGPLSDGNLTREELLDALYRTAETGARAEVIGFLEASGFTDQGWGVAGDETREAAWDVLWNGTEPPSRPDIEKWWAFNHGLRAQYWEPWIPVWEAYDDHCPEGVPGITC